MAIVTVEKNLVEDLARFKLNRVRDLINDILTRWKESSASSLIEKARDGTYENAENDAIELRQLLLEEKKMQDFLASI